MAVEHPRLTDLMDALRRAPVIAAKIQYADKHVEGICWEPSGVIVIDEAVCTTETILHELLHRTYRRWGEKRVEREADYLMRRMSDKEVAALYRLYKRVRCQRSRPVVLKDDEDAA